MTETGSEDPRYASNGTLWWKLTHVPGTRQRFGGEKRLAAWLGFELQLGDTFTMKDLRNALGADEDVPEDAEHLNRRLRKLREEDWKITSYKDDRNLPTDTYRLDDKGKRLWLGERNQRNEVSLRIRRLVFDRDGNRCVRCGIGAGEEYPGNPGKYARMTIGHRVPRERGGTLDPDNLFTECAWCNEPMRDQVADPETYVEVMAVVRNLRGDDLRSLLTWMQNGRRSRSRLDEAYDRARMLSPSEQDQMITALEGMVRR